MQWCVEVVVAADAAGAFVAAGDEVFLYLYVLGNLPPREGGLRVERDPPRPPMPCAEVSVLLFFFFSFLV